MCIVLAGECWGSGDQTDCTVLCLYPGGGAGGRARQSSLLPPPSHGTKYKPSLHPVCQPASQTNIKYLVLLGTNFSTKYLQISIQFLNEYFLQML